jgi:DNA-binding winged helix-turn-helix (wHTH) protein
LSAVPAAIVASFCLEGTKTGSTLRRDTLWILMKDALPERVRFGEFELDLQSGELRHEGSGVFLQDQPFKVLRMLVEGDGQIVGRKEIRNKLWPNDTIVEFDHSINVAIGNLRRALGDNAERPKFVQTIARRGYRLMVPVEWILTADDSVEIASRLPAKPQRYRGKKPQWLV